MKTLTKILPIDALFYGVTLAETTAETLAETLPEIIREQLAEFLPARLWPELAALCNLQQIGELIATEYAFGIDASELHSAADLAELIEQIAEAVYAVAPAFDAGELCESHEDDRDEGRQHPSELMYGQYFADSYARPCAVAFYTHDSSGAVSPLAASRFTQASFTA